MIIIKWLLVGITGWTILGLLMDKNGRQKGDYLVFIYLVAIMLYIIFN